MRNDVTQELKDEKFFEDIACLLQLSVRHSRNTSPNLARFNMREVGDNSLELQRLVDAGYVEAYSIDPNAPPSLTPAGIDINISYRPTEEGRQHLKRNRTYLRSQLRNLAEFAPRLSPYAGYLLFLKLRSLDGLGIGGGFKVINTVQNESSNIVQAILRYLGCITHKNRMKPRAEAFIQAVGRTNPLAFFYALQVQYRNPNSQSILGASGSAFVRQYYKTIVPYISKEQWAILLSLDILEDQAPYFAEILRQNTILPSP